MIIFRLKQLFIILIFIASLTYCKPVDTLLHGEITGEVTDSLTGQPLQAVTVKLNPVNNTSSTDSFGKFTFTHLAPDNYEVEVSMPAYDRIKQNVRVGPAQTNEITFRMNGIPVPKVSHTYLDFGMDTTVKHFTISNTGFDKLEYFLIASNEWIKISPASGDCTVEDDTITVTINKAGLTGNKHQEIIEIYSVTGKDIKKDIIDLYVNGVMDENRNYYNVVRIGSQTWMAENLNTGSVSIKAAADGIVKKQCYEGNPVNCGIYGGLYFFWEALNAGPSGRAKEGACPAGWHIPSKDEWVTLIDYAGGLQNAGVKLMEAGASHWDPPNELATNETGFTALPGGYSGNTGVYFWYDLKSAAYFWTSTSAGSNNLGPNAYVIIINNDASIVIEQKPWRGDVGATPSYSVRCLKD